MKTKTFDAVEMKRQCQEKVRRDFEGLSEEEQRERTEDWLANGGDLLAQLWRRIQPPSPAEDEGAKQALPRKSKS